MGKILRRSQDWFQGFWFSSLGDKMIPLDEMNNLEEKQNFKILFY